MLQAKLLRVLQERKSSPCRRQRRLVDVRVVQTHCNPMQQIKDGGFRADCSTQQTAISHHLTTTGIRQADIIPLAEHFVQHTTTMLGLPQSPGLSANVRNQLLAYPPV
ncbi:sigma 54-interacting transcriptional regulator [Vibrio lentus]|nr:sigma 54-interacting transcriptional regulator [Vibrio lentus]